MRKLLFQPFAFTMFAKLTVVAMLTEGYSGNFNFSSHHRAAAGGATPALPHFAWSLDVIALIAGIAVTAIAVGAGGPLSVAVRYYAFLFYGGRYARLGDLLEPPAAAPELPPAPVR